jgi:small-conductance mechanosensitive channel
MKILLLVSVFLSSVFGENFVFAQKPLMDFDGTSVTLLMIAKFLLILSVGFVFSWIYKHKIMESPKVKAHLSNANRTILANLGYYFIIFLTIITSFNTVGLNLSSLTVVAGALSVGIGFGLQNIVSNFISGIILMFEKSIQVGHYVELENGIRGVVSDIKLRFTTITTAEHIDILVPNSNFIQHNVTNLSLGDDILRLRIHFGVAYGTDVQRLEELIIDAIDKNVKLPHIRDSKDENPRVWMLSMSSSSIDFDLVIWVKGEYIQKGLSITSLYLIEIYNTLNNNGIVIPFPQLDLHIKELPQGREIV